MFLHVLEKKVSDLFVVLLLSLQTVTTNMSILCWSDGQGHALADVAFPELPMSLSCLLKSSTSGRYPFLKSIAGQ